MSGSACSLIVSFLIFGHYLAVESLLTSRSPSWLINNAGSNQIRQSPLATNSEEDMILSGASTESLGFLKNIQEYGNNRMARRAVGVLQKMSAYRIVPTEIHFTAALRACEKSDQYSLGVSVFEEMIADDVRPSQSTYEAVISLAERTEHFKEALEYFDSMTKSGIIGSTAICKCCIRAAGRLGDAERVFNLLARMRVENIALDQETYAAAIISCEENAAGAEALGLLSDMRREGFELAAVVHASVIWACVRCCMGAEALELFDSLEDLGARDRNVRCYSGAIWACRQTGDSARAIQLLKLMKFDGFDRDIVSYDGAISAVCDKGDWEKALDLYGKIGRDDPPIVRSRVTYELLIDVLDKAGRAAEALDIYLQAFREDLYSPWVPDSRLLDVSTFSPSVAKYALINALSSIKRGKIAPFLLSIIVAAEEVQREESLQDHIRDVLLVQEPAGVLQSTVRVIDGIVRLVVARDDLVAWVQGRGKVSEIIKVDICEVGDDGNLVKPIGDQQGCTDIIVR